MIQDFKTCASNVYSALVIFMVSYIIIDCILKRWEGFKKVVGNGRMFGNTRPRSIAGNLNLFDFRLQSVRIRFCV